MHSFKPGNYVLKSTQKYSLLRSNEENLHIFLNYIIILK